MLQHFYNGIEHSQMQIRRVLKPIPHGYGGVTISISLDSESLL